tara:strand:- start:1078 stop:1284 length:207 start_codon:yes stop_codon:yes gene_type:complete
MGRFEEIQRCKDDFWIMFERALKESGGGGGGSLYSDLRLTQVVDILAQNGIRMVYLPSRHVDRISDTK